MIKPKINLLFALIIVLLASAPNALAIGITPGRVTVDFQPSMQKTVEFTVLNNEHKDMKVMFGLMGELADYITLNTKSVDFMAPLSLSGSSFKIIFSRPSSMPV